MNDNNDDFHYDETSHERDEIRSRNRKRLLALSIPIVIGLFYVASIVYALVTHVPDCS